MRNSDSAHFLPIITFEFRLHVNYNCGFIPPSLEYNPDKQTHNN